MISRALERQIQDFVALIESQLARLIHIGHEKTKHLSRDVRETVLRDALVVAWRRREHLDPINEPIGVWFERCLFVARTAAVLPFTEEESEVLLKLSPAAPVVAHTQPVSMGDETTPDSFKFDAAVKLGKDCPPCWRCKYHQGWLPRRWPYFEGWQPKNEMDLVCKTIDERKVEIAKYVQGAYDPRLLED